MNQYEKNKSQEAVVIPMRYIGLVSASVLIVLVTIFMGGYFWGKKKALETFCKTIERDSLADHIFVALCGLTDYKESQATAELDEVVDEQETPIANGDATISADQPSDEHKTEPVVQESVQQPVVASNQPELLQEKDESATTYHAELIGFGTLQGAKRFATRLEKKHIPVTVNKRVSKTAKGRVVTWYQVVTKTYSDKDELVNQVNTIKQQERLNDVRIVSHC